jgi:hypothetical protein
MEQGAVLTTGDSIERVSSRSGPFRGKRDTRSATGVSLQGIELLVHDGVECKGVRAVRRSVLLASIRRCDCYGYWC